MRNRRIAAVALGFVLALAIAFVAACGSSSSNSSTSPAAGSGRTDPLVFSGTTLTGHSFALSSYRGRPVVVNFWASWCVWCAREMPDLVKFAAAHPDVAVIGVDVNDQTPAAQTFAAKYGVTYPLVADPDGQIFGLFASQGLPTTVFFNKDLKMVDKIVGATDQAGFEAGLQKAQ